MLPRTLARDGSLLLPCLIAVLAGIGIANVPERREAASRLASGYGRLPLSFEANRGQAPDEVRFIARGSGSTLLVGDNHGAMLLSARNGNRRRQAAVRWQLEGARKTTAR